MPIKPTDVACKSRTEGKKIDETLRCFDFPKLSQIKIGRHGHFFARELPKAIFPATFVFVSLRRMQFLSLFDAKDRLERSLYGLDSSHPLQFK